MNSKTNLSKLFPMIKTKEQILEEINSNDTLRTIFNNWPEHHKNEFLSICTGSKGVKMLYDSYFKEILLQRHLTRIYNRFSGKITKRIQRIQRRLYT